ncbi:HEAT repeat domain-containing protein [Candidatus Beckwithbacteria bacterium]|nr:HEAT repeat domain-containing protein [Candidatus Beckwithbacteria bacterium]
MKDLKFTLLYFALILGGIFILIFITTSSWIGFDVKEKCHLAKEKYGQEKCIDNLLAFIDDPNNNLKEKNNYIWALGQLGDKKALPILQQYYTGAECDHAKFLCQYELKKAINLLNNGANITAFVWRYNID